MEKSHHPPVMEEVYEQYFPIIYNYVYYRLLHRESSEDIVSQVFLKVAQNLERFDPEKASLKTWIFRIAEHTLIDFYRRKKPESSMDDEESRPGNALNIHFDEEYDRILHPQRRLVLEALQSLSERERLFIYYRYFLNITNREIARHMQMNENTVSAVMARARNKLKLVLEDQLS